VGTGISVLVGTDGTTKTGRKALAPAGGRAHRVGQARLAGDRGRTAVGQSLAELRARDVRPFETVVHSAPVVVASNAIYAAFDGATLAVLLPEAVNGLVRDRLGYRGVVMSDDLLAASATMHTDKARVRIASLITPAALRWGSPPRR
jgi:beta-N-acetylhexosaminidase